MANSDAQTRILCSPDSDARDVQMPHMHHVPCHMPHESCPICPSCLMPHASMHHVPCIPMSPVSTCPHCYSAQLQCCLMVAPLATVHYCLSAPSLHTCVPAHIVPLPRAHCHKCSPHQAPMLTCVPSHAHMPRATPSHATCRRVREQSPDR